MATVLVTRPATSAAGTAERIRSLGHVPVLAPVMAIRPLATARPEARLWQAILVTSRQAVPVVAELAWPLPVFAVGEGTEAALLAQGVAVAATAAGDGAALADLLERHLEPRAGALLHPTGTVRAKGLATALAAADFDYRPWPVYAAEPVAGLPPDVVEAVARGRVDAVTLYSPRTGRLFAARLCEDGLEDKTEAMVALCLSANVASAINHLRWRDIWVAKQPDEQGMSRLLEDLRH